jgi:very-short-patch-repair endonuclease
MQFVRAVHSRGESPASQSHLEVLLDHALRSRGVPVERQVRPLALPSGMRIRLDLAVPAIRWGIEIDVHPDHLLVQGTTKDKRRDRQCHLIGWQIERLTELDLLDVENAADELEALYRARRRAVAA